jgi:putative flippase GtrA
MPSPTRWLRQLFFEPTDHTLIQLFRYTFVGGFAFVVDFGSLFALTEFAGLHYLVSATIAFGLGLTTNYLISIVWVFSDRKFGSRWLEFALFGGIGVIGLGLNDGFMWVFTEWVGVHYMGSKMIATGIVYFWNFFARKFLVFGRGGSS